MGTKDIGVKDDICHDWIYYVGLDCSGVNTSQGIELDRSKTIRSVLRHITLWS